MYQFTIGDSILRLTDSAFISPDLNNIDYVNYLKWVEAGNIPEPAPAPPAFPNYRGFYDDLFISVAYQKLRTQAVTSLPLTLAAVEFTAAMGDAKAGIPNETTLQTCINNIGTVATDLNKTDWIEIGGLLQKNNLDNIYILPT